MEPPSHISIILDLSPTQWHLSSLFKNTYPLSFKSFLAQTLAFLNSHLAFKHENTLAVYGAFPGKRYVFIASYRLYDLHILYVFMISVLLYSSTDHKTELGDDSLADANTYLPFKIVDTAVTTRIGEEFDTITELEEEGEA